MNERITGLCGVYKCMNPEGLSEAAERDHLMMQFNIGADAVRATKLKIEAVQITDMCMFGFIRKGTATISVLHSAASCYYTGAPKEIRGKVVAFLGDRKGTMNPTTIIVPDRSWNLDKVKHTSTSVEMATFYGNEENASKLCTTQNGVNSTEKNLSSMVLIQRALEENMATISM